jgi:hypothetical protein
VGELNSGRLGGPFDCGTCGSVGVFNSAMMLRVFSQVYRVSVTDRLPVIGKPIGLPFLFTYLLFRVKRV